MENILIKNEQEDDDDDSLYSFVTGPGIGPARKRAITSLEKQAIKMVGNSAKKFKPAEPGCSVAIPIPEFDRGKKIKIKFIECSVFKRLIFEDAERCQILWAQL